MGDIEKGKTQPTRDNVVESEHDNTQQLSKDFVQHTFGGAPMLLKIEGQESLIKLDLTQLFLSAPIGRPKLPTCEIVLESSQSGLEDRQDTDSTKDIQKIGNEMKEPQKTGKIK